MKNYQYQTPFQLTAPVLDLDEAKAYLDKSSSRYSMEEGERAWGDEMDSFRDRFEDGLLTASFTFPDGCSLSKATDLTLTESDLSFAEGLEFPCGRGL